MTTREVAAFLRIRERKVYDLAGAGDIPCVRVTGKLLFPRALVQAWLVRHTHYGAGVGALCPRPPVVAGSHDPLLEWALREAQTGLATLFDGSLNGLERLAKTQAVAAGSHLPEEGADAWNVGHVERALAGMPVVVIEWARRERGLILPVGNPDKVSSIADLAGVPFLPRQRAAGSTVLLAKLLEEAGMSLDQLKLCDTPARSETEVALGVAEGRAAAGLGLAAMARRHGLAFLPLARERYDLILCRRDYFDAPVARLLEFTRGKAFAARANALEGYDVSGLGSVHYNAA